VLIKKTIENFRHDAELSWGVGTSMHAGSWFNKFDPISRQRKDRFHPGYVAFEDFFALLPTARESSFNLKTVNGSFVTLFVP